MSSTLVTLLAAVTAAGAGAETVLATNERYQGGEHTVELSGAFVGTVAFQGRIDAAGAWYTFASATAPTAVNVPGCFYGIRGNVTAYTSGSITLAARYPLEQSLAALAVNADIQTLLTRLSSARATLLDNLTRLDTTVSALSATADINNLIKLLKQTGYL